MTKKVVPKTEKESLDLAWEMIDQLLKGGVTTLKHLIEAENAILDLERRLSALETATEKKRLQ